MNDGDFREYIPSAGRWLSPDPGGLAAVSLANPQSFNRYSYVGSSPTNLVDPLGLGPCDNNSDLPACNHEPHINDAIGSGGSCYLDGIETSCGVVYMLLGAGFSAPCPNNFCSGFAPVGKGHYAFVQFVPHAGAADSTYDVISQPILDPSIPQNSSNYLNAVNAQLAYVIAGLRQQGATEAQIRAFIRENSEEFNKITVEGGNVHFGNVFPADSAEAGQHIFAFGCENNRCDNGLDFSHGGLDFHRDTTSPYYGLRYAFVHLAVDVLAGNFLLVIPR